MRRAARGNLRDFAAEVTRGLGFPRACASIIEILATQRGWLSFAELSRRVRISERSLRSHLQTLVNRGVLRRVVSVTPRRRLAYKYCIAPLSEILAMLRAEVLRRIERLKRVAMEIQAARRAVA
ncbi:MAG: helix-turn-helix domain-containing protein [Thermoplasmata archaeon]